MSSGYRAFTVFTTTGQVLRIIVPHPLSAHSARYSFATSSSPNTPRFTVRNPAA